MRTLQLFPHFVWVVWVGLLSCHPLGKTKPSERPPNIILIFTDDQGYADVGCFGGKNLETPNLDRMAREGARLTHFYTAQPVCSAARAALLTGCYPNRIGMHQALMPNSRIGLNPEETTIAEMLKTKGYQTAIFGKWHLGDAPQWMPLQQGFDQYFGIPYSGDMWPKHPQQGPIFNFGNLHLYENERIVDTLKDQSWLTSQITAHCVQFIHENRDKPFFLYVPHPQPHVPLYVSERFKGKSKAGLFGDVIMELDWSVGEIMAALKQHGLDNNTLVIYTSDNGPWLPYGNHAGSAAPLRAGKGTVWEGGVREPCIAWFPGRIPAGSTIETPLMSIDLLPTLAALTGAALPSKTIDGLNIWPILKGESTTAPHEALFFYYNINELQAVRYGDWKMYFPHQYRTLDGPPGRDGLPGATRLVSVEQIELYHLRHDPSETTNVAAQHPDVVRDIEILANAMRTRLGDALKRQKTGAESRMPGTK